MENKNKDVEAIVVVLLAILLVATIIIVVCINVSRNNDTNLGEKDKIDNVVSGDKEENKEQSSNSSGISADFKKAMDEYEKFMDEYIAFMKKYANSNGTDTQLLKDYSNYLILIGILGLIIYIVSKIKNFKFNKYEIIIIFLMTLSYASLINCLDLNTALFGMINRYEGLFVILTYYILIS